MAKAFLWGVGAPAARLPPVVFPRSGMIILFLLGEQQQFPKKTVCLPCASIPAAYWVSTQNTAFQKNSTHGHTSFCWPVQPRRGIAPNGIFRQPPRVFSWTPPPFLILLYQKIAQRAILDGAGMGSRTPLISLES